MCAVTRATETRGGNMCVPQPEPPRVAGGRREVRVWPWVIRTVQGQGAYSLGLGDRLKKEKNARARLVGFRQRPNDYNSNLLSCHFTFLHFRGLKITGQ